MIRVSQWDSLADKSCDVEYNRNMEDVSLQVGKGHWSCCPVPKSSIQIPPPPWNWGLVSYIRYIYISETWSTRKWYKASNKDPMVTRYNISPSIPYSLPLIILEILPFSLIPYLPLEKTLTQWLETICHSLVPIVFRRKHYFSSQKIKNLGKIIDPYFNRTLKVS